MADNDPSQNQGQPPPQVVPIPTAPPPKPFPYPTIPPAPVVQTQTVMRTPTFYEQRAYPKPDQSPSALGLLQLQNDRIITILVEMNDKLFDLCKTLAGVQPPMQKACKHPPFTVSRPGGEASIQERIEREKRELDRTQRELGLIKQALAQGQTPKRERKHRDG